MIAPVSYVYGISPATLSSEYDYPTVIALAKAANRFLSSQSVLHQFGKALPQVMAEYQPKPSAEPDRDGFKSAFMSHFKSKLE